MTLNKGGTHMRIGTLKQHTREAGSWKTRGITPIVLALLLSGAQADLAAAQFDVLEKLVSKVEGVSLYYQYGAFEPGPRTLTTSAVAGEVRKSGLSGFGVELSIALGTIPGRGEMTAEECAREKALEGDADTVDAYTETRTVDDRRTTTSVVRTRPRQDACKLPDFASMRLALGYSQLRGFDATDPSIELNGALSESPAFAIYMTFRPEERISPYIGVRAGRAELHALRAYDEANAVYDGTATTLQAGLAAGVTVTLLESLELVLEPSYVVRNFSSVEWRTVVGSTGGTHPAALPRRANMSGWNVAVGLDLPIPR